MSGYRRPPRWSDRLPWMREKTQLNELRQAVERLTETARDWETRLADLEADRRDAERERRRQPKRRPPA